ncbi:MAG TPA: hypothetical protein VF116_15525, partial [Ktedonobacterales bacterium]
MVELKEDLLQALAAQMERLQELVTQQQARLAQQEAKIDELSERANAKVAPASPLILPARLRRGPAARAGEIGHERATGRPQSRRALLKWGGATAAAAGLSVMASEQHSVHAAPAADGDTLIIGQDNLGKSRTSLACAAGSSAPALLSVDASSSMNTAAQAISAVANVSSGIGVFANSNDGIGAFGGSTTGVGVYGKSFGNSTGVVGFSNGSGSGVVGQSTSAVDLYAIGTGRVQQKLQGSAGTPTSGTYSKGEMIRDSNGDLFLCVADGTPGTWQQVFAAGATVSAATTTTLLPSGAASPTPLLTIDNSATPDGSGISVITSGGGVGVSGNAGSGVGVVGATASGTGVSGVATSGIGVAGNSSSGLDLAATGTGRIKQNPQGSAGAPSSGSHTKGEMIRDSSGDLFLCVADGTPGIWQQAFAAGATMSGSTTTTLQNAPATSPLPLLKVDGTSSPGAGGIWSYVAGGAVAVAGISNTGPAVAGTSGSGLDLLATGTGRMKQNLQASAGAPASGSYSAGEMIRDSNGELWLCVVSGSPGSWVRAAHAVLGYSGGATSYLSKPIRLL